MANKENIDDEIKKVKELKENGLIDDNEERGFTSINGDKMDEITRLRREYLKIDTAFTFDYGEELDFIIHNNIKGILNDLSEAIEYKNYNCEILEKIIVLLDLYLDIEVAFYNTLYILQGEIDIYKYLEKISKLSFDEIFHELEVVKYYNKEFYNKENNFQNHQELYLEKKEGTNESIKRSNR